MAGEKQEEIKHSLEQIKNLSITLFNQYKEMKPVIRISEAVFAVNGDISFTSGLPKAGKSTITRFMIATALMPHIPQEHDTISIRSEYCQGRKVIYLDTEQNPADTQKMITSILDIAGLSEQPENFIALNLREYSHSENLDYLKSLFHHYNDAYLWIIDGVTDFLPSANDETAGNEIIRYLMKMSSINDTCIVCLIHENSGNSNGKMRGHIGSEAARKCQGAISVSYEEDKGVHSIKSTYFRGSKRIEPIYWQFNENGKPVSCDNETLDNIKKIAEDKDHSKNIEIAKVLEKVFKNVNGTGLTSDILKQRVVLYAPPAKQNSSKDAIRKRNDRYFKAIINSRLLRVEEDVRDNIKRTIYHYDNPNLKIGF
ncbi:hypothetical protein VB796_02145 [Arcicella sp. LKC2W]|uniref:hypothetical protein n=1 Tax=Arcicella sp. LKC2W TaxID=2984198 RepID=UPI002B1FE333|nr:hypothetical protein [Arcicella sp. LKC2W]MEA5457819.1 hypothetical protein [Arcicella sp. LKC2W]